MSFYKLLIRRRLPGNDLDVDILIVPSQFRINFNHISKNNLSFINNHLYMNKSY
jgi:hypothetical protein